MEAAVQVFAVVNFAVIGASHLLRPRAWAEFFVHLRQKGDAGVFVVAFLSLGFGSVVVAFHSVWQGIPAVLTVIGWAQVAKAVLYFCWPGVGRRRLEKISLERARLFMVPGAALLALAALLAWHVVGTLR